MKPLDDISVIKPSLNTVILYKKSFHTSLEIGVLFPILIIYGFGDTTDYQKTFANYPKTHLSGLRDVFESLHKSRINILYNFDGLVKSGEILLVLR